MKMVFLGAPGVGKGTQAQLLSEKHGWRHISTGELLRAAVTAETPLGLKAKAAMDSGDLVADDIILGLIDEALENLTEPGFVLDGFPRNLSQAEALDAMLTARGTSLERVVLLKADREEVLRRLAGRGRSDDMPETIQHRFDVYEQTTKPLIGYYEKQGVLTRVDGVGGIDDIHQRIQSALGVA